MNFFTADIHFCDEKSMKADNRPFKSIKEYDSFVIRTWNKTANKNDTIYVAGDLLDCNGKNTYEWEQGLKLIKKIKAKIILVIGNNEQRVIDLFFGGDFEKFREVCLQSGISEVHTRYNIKMRGKTFHLVHQAVDCDKSKINLFGHTHLCSGLYHPYGLCISTDLNHFRLFTEDMIFGYLKRKKDYWEPDDNTNYINPFLTVEAGEVINIKSKNNKCYQKYLKDNKFKTKI